MTPQQLLQAGKLDEAIQAVSAEVRDNPQDVKRRTFLFELLCFAGDFSRAEKHLDLAAQGSQAAEMGALLYHAALHAERTRHDLFEKRQYPMPKSAAGAGEISIAINNKHYHSLKDADPRIGSNLEVFAAGSYMWIPFALLDSIEIAPPKRLRDLLWLPAKVRTSDRYEERELGEVLLPVLTPFASRHADPNVRLGRATLWEDTSEGETIPVGQKILLADDEEWPILEVRNVQIAIAQTAS
ncbi:MAG TPA: type VI secretion system accessory protein TagJ [Candidatus Methylomirabilis sp.]|nr:type VI secretion system accessory protein TagJ [Candidatus Methylomirabilis sp.]